MFDDDFLVGGFDILHDTADLKFLAFSFGGGGGFGGFGGGGFGGGGASGSW